MSSNADQVLTVDQVKALLGPPPVMPGESAEEYMNWWMAFVEPDKPKTFMAWLEINELAHKEWELKRLRGYGPALVKQALIAALTSILLSRYDSLLSEFGGFLPMKNAATDYFGNDATARQEAREIIESLGITEEQIVAKAMVTRGKEMLIVDRMDSNRANASRLLRRAIDRRAETGSIPPVQTDD